MSLSRAKNFLMISLFLFVLVLTGLQRTSYAYYGGFGGIYGMSGLYGMGGLYGGGLYGGLYGGLGGLYGTSGLYGLNGLYGGLYGGSYGGLYGGLYGMYGGLYGSSLYGVGGYSPFGLQNMYYTIQTGTGLSYQVPFLQIAPYAGYGRAVQLFIPKLV